MHTHLDLLYAAKKGGEISAAQWRIISLELSGVDPVLIPSEQVQNVLDFLNQQLLHQQIDTELVQAIETLVAKLEKRK